MNTKDLKFSAEGRFLKWGEEAAEKAQDIVDYWEEHNLEEYAEYLPTTLTIIWHPLPESE